MFHSLMTRDRTARRRRPTEYFGNATIPAVIELLEVRRLLSATNQTITIPANQTNITFNVLAADSDPSAMLQSITTPSSGITSFPGGDSTSGNVTYSLGAISLKSLADFTIANNAANAAITDWGLQETQLFTTYYNTEVAAIHRFGDFLDGWSNGVSVLGSIATGISDLTSSPFAAAGAYVVNKLTAAYAANTSASLADVVAKAVQSANDDQTTAFNSVNIMVASFRATYAAQLALVPNPAVYTSDTFQYTQTNFQCVGTMPDMPGMPGGPMFASVPSTATITIAMNVTDYTPMINNINAWMAANSADLNLHALTSASINNVYAGTLLEYASDRGWTETWHPSVNYWGGDATDWPYIFDSEDIAQELTRINYRP